MSAPFGNRNACKSNRIWGDELRRAIAQDERGRVRAAVEALLDKAADGDLEAIKEIANRLDGRPSQAIQLVPDDAQQQRVTFVLQHPISGEERPALAVAS